MGVRRGVERGGGVVELRVDTLRKREKQAKFPFWMASPRLTIVLMTSSRNIVPR